MVILVVITLFLVACSDSVAGETPSAGATVGAVTVTKTIQLTSSPTPDLTATSAATPTLTPTLPSTSTQTPLSTPTPDLAATVVAMNRPRIQATYPSPDGEWQAEVVIYDCAQVNEGDVLAYEQLKLTQVSNGTEKIADNQLQYCGGLGAYGLEGLFWASNNRYFYYTNAREGVPDGCGYWERPIIRFDVMNESIDYLGGGSVSPDGSKIATWQDRVLVIWDVNQGEFGRAAAVAQSVGPGSIVWSPDSQALVYVQATTYCPLSGKSYLVRLDLPELKPNLLFESEMPTFGGVIWDTAHQIRLFDEKNQEWTYNFATRELKPSS